ncbi:flagellar assembly protein A [Clostridium sp. Marseille-Q2269]|uniref:flagellar assembly protein A n=1 Tax=Clostridium sp. Marseille-Q2269 TaxID=2942205 RepID=UPI002072AEAF|nr:flagellar assembly protein A [Clostridium sp. Marseille-Q2269]
MKKTIYSCSTLDKCINKACKELGIEEENLNYEIIEEKQGFFMKKTTILVDGKEEVINEKHMNSHIENNEQEDIKVNEIEKNEEVKKNNGKVKVVHNKVIVTNPKDGGNPAVIAPGDNIIILVDGERIKSKEAVFEQNKIELIFEEIKAHRELNIETNKDNMEAYISVTYRPEIKYEVKDIEEKDYLILSSFKIEENDPPHYTKEEIKEALGKMGIVYGIVEENLQQCTKNNCIELLIARGKETINEEDEIIEIKFTTDSKELKLEEDKTGNVDFKSIGSIESVKPGDVLAVRKKGKEGQDGIDIKGIIKKYKPGKRIILKPGQGSTLIDQDTIVAVIEGKPCVKSNVFYVYQVHEVKGDVDISTGNIKFIGDVVVQGSVKEGMKVEAGNSVEIKKHVERAEIISKSNLNIQGNIINSNIYGGGEDTVKVMVVNKLEKLRGILTELISAVEEIKRFNLLGEGKKDGEIIKILIENKFKGLTKVCIAIMANINMCRIDDKEDEIVGVIRKKLIGLGPVHIKNYGELEKIVSLIDEKIKMCKERISLPVNVNISYCQDSKIQSTGDIYITGKGEYISKLTSNNNIYFTKEDSVARGGHIIARNEIRCKEVGSEAGVITKLQTLQKGHIYVDVAYQNTIFIIWDREYLLETPSRNIHAYLDKKGEILVEKFVL